MAPNRDWIHPLRDWATDPEESANTITHGLGFALSVIGAVVLMMRVAREGDGWRFLGCLIYALSLVAVYAMSTLSHVCVRPHRKRFFQILDQAFIYLLIVGTYTPFSLAFLRTSGWWILLGAMWVIAIGGFLSKVIWAHRIEGVAMWIYLLLGWLPIVSAPSLSKIMPASGLWWALVGGLFYSVGTIFLILDNRVRHFHAVWHLCVIAGSTCHFMTILVYIAPAG